jgi:integrase
MKTKAKAKANTAVREAFKLSRFLNPSGVLVWRVSGTKKDGKRVRENYKTEAEAVNAKGDLERGDLNLPIVPMLPTRLTRSQLDDAERACGELLRGTLLEAVRFFNANYQDPLRPINLPNAIDKFNAERAKENLRPETLKNLRFRLGAFKDFMPKDKNVSEILPDQINEFLHRKNGKARGFRTIRNDRLALSVFFKWCKTNKHVTENCMAAVANVKVDRKRPAIFDLPTVRGLLKAATDYEGGKTLPYFVLGLFCGLRPTEAERLTWDKIDLTDKLIAIETDGTKVRGGSERFVAISDNAVEWLREHSLSKKPIAIDRKDFDAVKALAKLDKWPQDVLRHTAISNYQAEHRHEGLTAEWAGNSVEVVKAHYRRAIKPADAKCFWAIKPDGPEIPALKAKAA